MTPQPDRPQINERQVAEPRPPQLGLSALFLKFLRFGCLAFGGPVAQIAMIRQAVVEDERWISKARFNRLLAVMQVLPGPEAHELCVHLGIMARGRIGGLLAGLGFMLPGFVLMLAAGWLYETWVMGRSGFGGVLLGVQLVVLAIIVRAVQRIASHVIEDRLLLALAVASFAATLLGVPFWAPLVGGAMIYGAPARVRWLAIGLAIVLSVAAYLVSRHAGSTASAASAASAVALFVAGLKGGLLTFGGAYTSIPYVRGDTVDRGWIADASFLDGVAIAGILPAPLVIFATFVGYVAGGWIGALAITAGMFLPAFAFSMILYERLEGVVENPALHRVLAGVAAAAVGIIAATCVQIGWPTFARAPAIVPAVAIFAIALAVAWFRKGKLVPPALLVAGALVGWLVF